MMTLIFLGICAFAFRPGSRKTHDEIAGSIFRNENAPAAAKSSSSQTEA